MLGGQTVGAEVPFLEGGVDSLLSIELMNAINDSLSLRVTPAAMLEYPTIAALSDFLVGMLPRTIRAAAPTVAVPLSSSSMPSAALSEPATPAEAAAHTFEPFILAARSLLLSDGATWDERFTGYGKNKIEHAMRLTVQARAQWVVLPHGFLIARAHARSYVWELTYGVRYNRHLRWRTQALYLTAVRDACATAGAFAICRVDRAAPFALSNEGRKRLVSRGAAEAAVFPLHRGIWATPPQE